MENKIREVVEAYSDIYYFTLAKKIAKRNEFVLSLGQSKFLPKELIWENNEYVLFGEGLSEELIDSLKLKIERSL